MADTAIHGFTDKATPVDTDELAGVQSPYGAGDDRRFTWANIKATMKVYTDTLYVAQTLYDANSILKADSDNTPVALTVAEARIVGRKTGGSITALTSTEVTAMLDAVVGDSGAGGTKGLVPAPAAGDAAAGKFLKADGTWAVPAGGSFSWGSSASGTTDGGLSLALANNSDDGAAALKLTAGNTQANEPLLAGLNIGTSGKVGGLLIRGTGGSGVGPEGSFSNHLCIWGDTAGNSKPGLLVTNGVAGVTFNVALYNDGRVNIGPTDGANGAAFYIDDGNMAVGSQINGNGAFFNVRGFQTKQSSGFVMHNFDHSNTGYDLVTADRQANVIYFNTSYTRAYGNFVQTETVKYNRFVAAVSSNHASANVTHHGAAHSIETTATQTAGTLLADWSALSISHQSYAASTRTWAAVIVHDNAASGGLACGIDMSSFSVDEPLIKAVADAISTLGTLTGQIAVDVGGTTYYIPYYTTGS